MTERALERQVGGGHYVKLRIQPVEFALINGLDAAAFSILKYLLRHLHRMTPEDRHRYRFTQAYQLGKLASCVVKADRLEDQLAGGEA